MDAFQAVERVLLVFACHVFVFYSCYSFIVPRYFEKKRYTASVLFILMLLLVLTPLRILIERHFADSHVFALNLRRKDGVGFGLILFSEIAVGAFACLVRLAASSFINKQKMDEMRSMHLESELRFLKAQMSPHFLFNTINNIYSLTLIGSEKAPRFLLKLSALLRYLLYECDKHVSYQQEENALLIYSELFQLRYDEQLNLKVRSQVSQKDKLLEPMLLIPILENAFKYSGLGINEAAFVKFSIVEAGSNLHLDCRNSIMPGLVHDQPGGIGLNNIRKRLEMAYYEKYELEINETETTFNLKLNIPLL